VSRARSAAGNSSRLRSRIALALAATGLALLAAEGLARLAGVGPRFGQLIFVRGVPTRTVDGVPLWSDLHPRADGEDVRRAAADAGAFTIVGLGDSIMYGVGQTREETYLEQTRRALAGRTERHVEILNLAVPGYNTMQENAVFKEIDGQLKPDLVIVHYWVDDAHQYTVIAGHVVDFGNVSDDGRAVGHTLPLPPLLSDFLLVHSRLYDLLTQAAVAYRRTDQPDDWSRVSAPLADIQTRAGPGHLLVLASPDLSGAQPQPNNDLPRLRELGAARGFDVVDVSSWLPGVTSQQVGQDACHFNAEGHRLVGERLADFLLEHQLQKVP
jgi:lysophospholipase L1-like esterase